jgi:hypothetical protein
MLVRALAAERRGVGADPVQRCPETFLLERLEQVVSARASNASSAWRSCAVTKTIAGSGIAICI